MMNALGDWCESLDLLKHFMSSLKIDIQAQGVHPSFLRPYPSPPILWGTRLLLGQRYSMLSCVVYEQDEPLLLIRMLRTF